MTEDFQNQLEEIRVLASIFQEDFQVIRTIGIQNERELLDFEYSLDPQMHWSIECNVLIHFEKDDKCFCINPYGWEVCCLPPVTVSFVLEPGYPSSCLPQATRVDSIWLTDQKKKAYCEILRSLWEQQGPGVPIIFVWTDAVKADIASSDFVEIPNEDVLLSLVRYDALRKFEMFETGLHQCGVCFEIKIGKHFMTLSCGHRSYCTECLKSASECHVASGSLEQLKCFGEDCQVPFAPHILQRLLTRGLYQKWESLTLSKTLDAMHDAVYCPKCCTVCLEETDHCAQCTKCLFVFCSMCNGSWHTGTDCVSEEIKMKLLEAKAKSAGQKEVARIRKQQEEMESIMKVKSMSKQCPQCGMSISHSGGCNKMTCSYCASQFCYKCGQQIRDYEHFRDGCNLFEDAEIQRWHIQWQQHIDLYQQAGYNNYDPDEPLQREHVAINKNGICPMCGQYNEKVAGNNHMRCYACGHNFCHICGCIVRKGDAKKHYAPGKPCKQHT